VGIDRATLIAQLLAAACARHPDSIHFHWSTSLHRIDFNKQRLVICSTPKTAVTTTPPNTASRPASNLSSSSSTPRPSPPTTADGSSSAAAADNSAQPPLRQLRYDLLIGADGARSAVRREMASALRGMLVTPLSSPVAAMEYKAFHALPDCDAIRALLPKHATHSSQQKAPRRGSYFFALTNPTPDNPSPGSVTLYANLNNPGTWSGVMYLPAGSFGALGGDAAAHAAAVRRLVPPGFPEAWVAPMASQMAAEGASGVTPMHQSSRLAWPSARAVLLGDAVHNVTPQLGQGCNSALEDAALLNEALDAAAPEAAAAAAAAGTAELDAGVPCQQQQEEAASAAATRADAAAAAALQRYETLRLPQAHALQRIEEENAWVRRPAAFGQEPLRMSYMRVAWACTMLLLAAAHAVFGWLPTGGGGSRVGPAASLFENVMATSAPYNKLRVFICAAPVACVLLAAGALGAGGLVLRKLLVFGAAAV